MLTKTPEIEIRECLSLDELDACVALQRQVFGLPDIELSPRRHLIVSRRAGGWTLGAFAGKKLAGFLHYMVAANPREKPYGYSHMAAVLPEFQNKGVGAALKWAQRIRSLSEGREFITWTWKPMQARNAHFNLNRLGATVTSYGRNFYGTGYDQQEADGSGAGTLESDRLFAEWDLNSTRVAGLANGEHSLIEEKPALKISIPRDWEALLKASESDAAREQTRVREEFEGAFRSGLVCRSFDRETSSYLLYLTQQVK